jgi:transposase
VSTSGNKVKPTARARTQKKRTGGRPTKYSLVLAKRIFKHISEGCSREAAASLAGITASTLHNWMNENSEFLEEIKRADARFERECVRDIRKAGKRPRNWPARAWLLERKYPGRYGKIDRNVIESTTMQVAPDEAFIAAVNRALGVSGEFIALVNGVPMKPGSGEGPGGAPAPQNGSSGMKLLPERTSGVNSGEQDKLAELDSEDELAILP